MATTTIVGLNSRLRYADLFNRDGFDFWGLPEYPEIPDQPDDIDYVVMSGDRLDLLARDNYGDPTAKFVIMLANGMELDSSDLRVGETIRIPSPRWVRSVMNKKYTKF